MNILKSAGWGLVAGFVATVCFLVGSRWVGYFAVLVLPPVIGLVFGLFHQSLPGALRGAVSGIVGTLFGNILFTLRGTIFLRLSISLTEAGVPAHLLVALTNPFAWALALVGATAGSSKRSLKAGVIAAVLCFIGVNLAIFSAPSTAQLEGMRMRGDWLAHQVAAVLTFSIHGVVLGAAVGCAEVMTGGAQRSTGADG